MKLIGIMPVRNEAWVLGLSARVALEWCDELLILVHASTDRTTEIARELTCEYPDRAFVAFEEDPKWDEMQHRQMLLMAARDRGATHVAIVDADEILTGNLLGKVRHWIEAVAARCLLRLPGYNLRNGSHRYHANGLWANRLFSVAFADHAKLFWSGDRFHQREPAGSLSSTCPVGQGNGGVMHLWGASERRLRAKHALYKLTERLRWPEKAIDEIEREYNRAIHPSMAPWTYADVQAEWWAPYRKWMSYLDVDAAPWQEFEVERLIEACGAGRFAGLDLFHVANTLEMAR